MMKGSNEKKKERKEKITSTVVCPSRPVLFHRRFGPLGCGRRRGVVSDGRRHWTLVSVVSWGVGYSRDRRWVLSFLGEGLTSKVGHNDPITTTGTAQSGIGLAGFVWHGS